MAYSRPFHAVLLAFVAVVANAQSDVWDKKGYITFAPTETAGIGQQLDHLLGAMHLAKQLDRTLIMPHLHDKGFADPIYEKFAPVGMYYDAEEMTKAVGVRALSWAFFMNQFGPEYWPANLRRAYCLTATEGGGSGCVKLQGYGRKEESYFDSIKVGALTQSQLSEKHDVATLKALDPAEHPVIVLMNGLASPVTPEAAKMQKGLVYGDKIAKKARMAVLSRNSIQKDTVFVALHMRVGEDLQAACDGLDSWDALFENGAKGEGFYNAANCVKGDDTPPKSACFAERESVKEQVQQAIDHTGACFLFISADMPLSGKGDMRGVFDFIASPRDIHPAEGTTCKHVRIFSQRSRSVRNLYKEADPLVDQYILSKASHFIGNCVSSFSASVAREREVLGRGQETAFFSVPFEYTVKEIAPAHAHDEL